MGSTRFLRNALKISLATVAAGCLVFLYGNIVVAHDRPRNAWQGSHYSNARQREAFLTSRLGVQFGVPKQAREHALAQKRTMTARQSAGSAAVGANVASPAIPGTAWSFIGPQPSSEKPNFTGKVIGSNVTMTGRVTAIAADDTGLIVVGTASGGLWISTNNGMNFASVFDREPTEAIGAVALNTTTTPSTIYVGTGEGNNTVDSLYGAGLFKSTNLGTTWTPLAAGTFDVSTANGGPPSFTALAIDPSNGNRIFAGVTSGFSASRADAGIPESDSSLAGLWFSSDGGNTWTQYLESMFDNCDLFQTGSGMSPCPADDVKIDPLNPMNVYVAIDSDTVYSSNNGGVSFNPASFTNSIGMQGRESLAIGPKVPAPIGPANPPGGVVYAMIGNGATNNEAEYLGMFVSFDAGATWNPGTVATPNVPVYTANGIIIDGTSPGDFSQEFYDQAILVSPTSGASLYFGGIGLYSSSDYGNDWTFMPALGGVHPDVHALVYNPFDKKILIGTDGGLFRYDPSLSGNATFVSLNQQINASQIQGIGVHPTDATKLIAGFQSGGTQLYSGGIGTWTAPDSETGDGGFAFFDPNVPNFLYHTFSLDDAQVFGSLVSESTDGGMTWCSNSNNGVTACNLPNNQDGWSQALADQFDVSGDVGPVFYPPIAVDPSVPNRVLFGAQSVYESTDGMAHWTQQTDYTLTSGNNVNSTVLPEGDPCPADENDCGIEDLEFAPSDHTHLWALAMSNLDGNVAFAINNTTQGDQDIASIKLSNPSDKDGAFWSDVTGGMNTILLQTNCLGTLSTQATSIAPDPNNKQVAYLALSGYTADTAVGHIYKTVNFGTSWTEADGNSAMTVSATQSCSKTGVPPDQIAQSPTGLPDVPVLKLLVDSTDDSGSGAGCGGSTCSRSIFAGTDIGVFHTSDGGNTWQPFSTGMPDVPVYDLAQNSNGVVFAGTHGRGGYILGNATMTPTPTTVATSTPTPTPTATAAATSSVTPTPAKTPTPTATAIPTRTATATPTARLTTTPTSSPSPTSSRTATPTATRTPTPSPTPTNVAPTPTPTAVVPTATPSGTPTPNGARLSAPRSVVLPPAGIGVTASMKKFVIHNLGKTGDLIGTAEVTSPSAFTISQTSLNIAPHASATEVVTFTPGSTSTSNTASVTITSNDAKNPTFTVNLSGRGLPGRLVAPASFVIRAPIDGSMTANLTVRNAGKGLLTITWPPLTSSVSAPYSVTGNTMTLNPATSLTIPITFTATTKGRAPTAPFTITASGLSTPGTKTVTLRGIGQGK